MRLKNHGTVGAVALDRAGHLAAATSTGGYNNKAGRRIGDTPIVGAGTYARDGACAVSGTGKGEFFIRYAVGHEVASRITISEKIWKRQLARSSWRTSNPTISALGWWQWLRTDQFAAPYNTDGMFRGWVTPEGQFSLPTHGEVFEC